jgi:hypothetical protein
MPESLDARSEHLLHELAPQVLGVLSGGIVILPRPKMPFKRRCLPQLCNGHGKAFLRMREAGSFRSPPGA